MKRSQRRQQGRGAFDVIEEATHLLRAAPAATLAVYFLGAIPFVLALLYFWADMSRSPLAPRHLAGGSLGVAVLFFWMKFCHAIFSRRIRAQAAREPMPNFEFRRCSRIALSQAIIQPLGLFLLPVALIPALPFPWVYAFFQNVTALDDGSETGTAALMKNARKQASLWPVQNYTILAIILMFAFCVFLNWMTVCMAVPALGKTLFGIESVFTRSPYAMLNTTFLAAMAGLTYLCVDPIIKVIYALRTFYGESLQSGEDLKAELKPYSSTAIKTIIAVFVFLALLPGRPVLGQETNLPATISIKQSISPGELDHAISQTIAGQKYVWRMPREQTVEPDSKDGLLAQFFKKIGAMIRDWAKAVVEWIAKLLHKLSFRSPSHVESSGYGWIMSLHVLLYGLVAAVVVALIIFLVRFFRARRSEPAPVASEAIETMPDISDENVRADQLPEDGWTKLARELLERGEFRLAMRAFYLAALAHLAARNLISIARFKSNRDYEWELRRRAHAFPALLAAFGENVSLFESIWYGMHETDYDVANRFAINLEKLKTPE